MYGGVRSSQRLTKRARKRLRGKMERGGLEKWEE
jgi:hypothetical protein